MCSTHKQNKYCRGFRKGVFVVTSKTITKSFLRDESKVDRNQSIQNITVLAVPAQTSVSSCTGRGTWKRHKKVMPSIHPPVPFVCAETSADRVRYRRGAWHARPGRKRDDSPLFSNVPDSSKGVPHPLPVPRRIRARARTGLCPLPSSAAAPLARSRSQGSNGELGRRCVVRLTRLSCWWICGLEEIHSTLLRRPRWSTRRKRGREKSNQASNVRHS